MSRHEHFAEFLSVPFVGLSVAAILHIAFKDKFKSVRSYHTYKHFHYFDSLLVIVPLYVLIMLYCTGNDSTLLWKFLLSMYFAIVAVAIPLRIEVPIVKTIVFITCLAIGLIGIGMRNLLGSTYISLLVPVISYITWIVSRDTLKRLTGSYPILAYERHPSTGTYISLHNRKVNFWDKFYSFILVLFMILMVSMLSLS